MLQLATAGTGALFKRALQLNHASQKFNPWVVTGNKTFHFESLSTTNGTWSVLKNKILTRCGLNISQRRTKNRDNPYHAIRFVCKSLDLNIQTECPLVFAYFQLNSDKDYDRFRDRLQNYFQRFQRFIRLIRNKAQFDDLCDEGQIRPDATFFFCCPSVISAVVSRDR